MKILRRVRRVQLAARTARVSGATWWTWSLDFRRAIARTRMRLRDVRPRLCHLSLSQEYAYTYGLPRTLVRSGAVDALRPFVRDLLRVEPGTGIRFLTSLSCEAEGWALHDLFAVLRTLACDEAGDQWAALHAPLSATGTGEGEFPLHADLYRPSVLMNVFEQPAPDGSGRAVFLPTSSLLAAARRCVRLPKAKRARLVELVTGSLVRDGFEEFYDLLHGDHSWCGPLASRLASTRIAVGLGAYEGYLLHDRRWLHGREAPLGGVPKKRVHRLIYEPILARQQVRHADGHLRVVSRAAYDRA